MSRTQNRARPVQLHAPAFPHAGRSYNDLAEAFGALADPSRVKIIYSLLEGERCVGDLARALGLSVSSVSQHLRLLRTLRWAKNRRQGRMVFYSLDDAHVRELLDIGLRHIQGRE
ncbi:MAG: helix-turn-helix transcriptional regulator [Chloroflexi bacterium]|nr:helix-turn-helix transcriptional regulator [Chloroflexota bacterium]